MTGLEKLELVLREEAETWSISGPGADMRTLLIGLADRLRDFDANSAGEMAEIVVVHFAAGVF